MIEVTGISKRYGSTVAVSDLTFSVQPGAVTGFLGPNGAGKSTTMRLILGLDRPTEGEALICGEHYRKMRSPLREVGALLDAGAVQGGRRASHHLLALARSNRIPSTRVDAVLDRVGLGDVARRRLREFSLGMRQRFGIAAALLGDPGVVLFDEPFNGLDTEGIRWVRQLMRDLADDGRTVLVSSHLMSEVELVADRLVVIGQGRLLADSSLSAFVERASTPPVLVRSPDGQGLVSMVEAAGGELDRSGGDSWTVVGLTPAVIGDAALEAGVALHELTPLRSSLEDVYSELVNDTISYRTSQAAS